MPNIIEQLLGHLGYSKDSHSNLLEKGYLALDIEITKQIPDQCKDWNIFRPFGISCAATVTSKGDKKIWHGWDENNAIADKMSQNDIVNLINYLNAEIVSGKTIVTWNGLAFDFDVLAEESDWLNACRNLATTHIDMMFHLLCAKGYPLSLDKAAKGMGLSGKPIGINGSLAPKYWAEGRRQDVLNYVMQDAITTLNLFLITENKRYLHWMSNNNNQQTLNLPHGWLSVQEALKLPLPDTSWMKDPLTRNECIKWVSNQKRAITPDTTTRGKDKVTSTIVQKPLPIKQFTYTFPNIRNGWWRLKSPSEEGELSMGKFPEVCDYEYNQSKHRSKLIQLAIREIALTYGGTNLVFEDGLSLEQSASIDEIESFLLRFSNQTIIGIWYAVGEVYPTWGPDTSKSKTDDNHNDLSEISVGIFSSDYYPDDYDDYYYDDNNY
jgi:hypothetical protein